MTDKLSEIEKAAYKIAIGLEDVLETHGPEYTGNVADALFRIGDALNRIADNIEGLANATLVASGK